LTVDVGGCLLTPIEPVTVTYTRLAVVHGGAVQVCVWNYENVMLFSTETTELLYKLNSFDPIA
jgi:hypothetical protein